MIHLLGLELQQQNGIAVARGASFLWREKGRRKRRDIHGGGSAAIGASMADKKKKERGEVGGNSLICMEQEERRCWLLSLWSNSRWKRWCEGRRGAAHLLCV